MEKRYLNEIKVAEEFIKIAEEVVKVSLRTSANRVYFALEKAVIGFLLFKGLEVPKNHQKIWDVSSELLGEDSYQLFRELYDLRMQADYGTESIIVEFNEKIVMEKINKVNNFINMIKDMSKEEKDGDK